MNIGIIGLEIANILVGDALLGIQYQVSYVAMAQVKMLPTYYLLCYKKVI